MAKTLHIRIVKKDGEYHLEKKIRFLFFSWWDDMFFWENTNKPVTYSSVLEANKELDTYLKNLKPIVIEERKISI